MKLFRVAHFVVVAFAAAVLGAAAPSRLLAQATPQIFTPTGKEQVRILPPGSAFDAYIPLSALRDGAQYSYTVPTTGFTIAMTAEQSVLSLNPAGTLANGVVTLPPTLYDGKIVTIFSSQVVTSLTLATSNGATFVPAASTGLFGTITNGGVSISFVYDLANNQWHRMQ